MSVGFAADSDPVLTFDSSSEVVDVAPFLMVLEDTGGTLGLSDLPGKQFEPAPGGAANFGLSSSAWWVRFTLQVDESTVQDLVLRQNYPVIDLLEVWVIDDDRVAQHWKTGDRLPFATRPLDYRDFLFPLDLTAGDEYTVYLRVASEGAVNMGLQLYTSRAIFSQAAGEQLALGAYFGSFLLLAISILLLYLFDRESAYLYYFFYVLSYSNYMAAFNGIAYQYLWPENPGFASVSQVVLLSLSLFFLLQFSRTILNMRAISILMDRLAQGLQLLIIPCLLAARFLSYGTVIRPLAGMTLATMLIVLSMGAVSYRARQAAARYYLLAWSFFLLGVIAYLFKTFGLLPHNFLTQYGFQIGSLFEFVLLSVALSVRVRELKRQTRTDALTGLANRARFDELIAEEFASCSNPNAVLSLLVIDVDHFKRFNDTYGHDVGDRVLQRVAEVLRLQARRPNVACRYGGEEFAVILPRTGTVEAMVIAERLRERVASEKGDQGVTISIGVATATGGSFAYSRDLFKAADRALYHAKKSGRNRVADFQSCPDSGLDANAAPIIG